MPTRQLIPTDQIWPIIWPSQVTPEFKYGESGELMQFCLEKNIEFLESWLRFCQCQRDLGERFNLDETSEISSTQATVTIDPKYL